MKTPAEIKAAYQLNKDKINERRRARYALPEVKAKIAEYRRTRRQQDEEFRRKESERRDRNRDPERNKEHQLRYRETHREEIAARQREKYAEDPEYRAHVKERNRQYRQRMKANGEDAKT